MESKILLKSNTLPPIMVRENMYGLKEEFEYYSTENGTLVINEVPQNLSKYYPENYYSFNQNIETKNKIIEVLKKIRNKYSLEKKGILGRLLHSISPDIRLSAISEVNVFTKESKILDVGCGDGKLVSNLFDLGYKNVSGIDPFLKEDSIKQYSLLKKSIYEITEKQDVIILYHVFEHINEPERALKQLKECLNPGGVLIIAIPLADSFAFAKYKENWVQLDAPRHLYLFSSKDFIQLCNSCDLTVTKVEYNSNEFQFWGSEQYQSGISLFDQRSYLNGIKNSIFNKRKIKDFKCQALKLNKEKNGDQAVFFIKNN